MRYIKSSKVNKYIIVGVILFFLLSSFVVPFIHEMGHVIVLKIYGCNYWTKFEYDWFNNLYGKVYNRCNLTQGQEEIVYLAGVGITFIIGLLFLFYDVYLNRKHKFELSIIFGFVSFAFLLDLIDYLFYPEGDIKEFLKLIHREGMLGYCPILGTILILTLLTYLIINISHEMNIKIIEDIEEEVKREENKIFSKIKGLLKRIRTKKNKEGSIASTSSRNI